MRMMGYKIMPKLESNKINARITSKVKLNDPLLKRKLLKPLSMKYKESIPIKKRKGFSCPFCTETKRANKVAIDKE